MRDQVRGLFSDFSCLTTFSFFCLKILVQLSSDCDMETTIRSVDYLRRLDSEGDELELRIRFLQVKIFFCL